MMDSSSSRRRFLHKLVAFSAAGRALPALASAQNTGASEPAQSSPRLPRIRLMIGPGTLPSMGKSRMDLVGYRFSGIPPLTGEQLMATMPEVAGIADVAVDHANPWQISTHDDLRKLAVHVDEVLRSPQTDGVVLVQGSNTLEETAYFLSLTVHSDKPIVVTAAQRPFNGLSADGPINLLDSIRVACAPATRGKGVVVTANGEINSARDVAKTNTYHLQTFRSRDLGVLGYADADRVEYYRTPHRRHTVNSELGVAGVTSVPYVDIAYVHTGTRAGLASAIVQLGAKGLVVATVGAGAPGLLAKELSEIIRNRSAVVVQSSRVGEGRVVRNNNWFEPGMVVADTLSPQKAAVLLSLALMKTSSPDEVQRIFDEY